jgi:hypothetical protein
MSYYSCRAQEIDDHLKIYNIRIYSKNKTTGKLTPTNTIFRDYVLPKLNLSQSGKVKLWNSYLNNELTKIDNLIDYESVFKPLIEAEFYSKDHINSYGNINIITFPKKLSIWAKKFDLDANSVSVFVNPVDKSGLKNKDINYLDRLKRDVNFALNHGNNKISELIKYMPNLKELKIYIQEDDYKSDYLEKNHFYDAKIFKKNSGISYSLTPTSSARKFQSETYAVKLKKDKKEAEQREKELAQRKIDEKRELDLIKKLNFGILNLGIKNEEFIKNIFSGRFDNIETSREELLVRNFLNNYIEQYSNRCRNYLPKDKIEILESYCEEYSVGYDIYGIESSRKCAKWKTKPTGVFAKKEIFNANRALDKFQLKNVLQVLGDFHKAVREPDGGQKLSKLIDNSIEQDIIILLKNNSCNNKGLLRFEENLVRFAMDQEPIIK